MLQKTIDKLARKERKTWTGLYTRATPTKIGKQRKADRKYYKNYDLYE